MSVALVLWSVALAAAPAQEFELWVANDGFAAVRDGVRRSDEGATAGVGAFYRRDTHRGSIAYHIFTERLGSLRTEWLTLEYAQSTEWYGRFGFDRIVGYGGVGVQITGDLGGAELQNALHRATPPDRDLTFDTGLQATYSAPTRAALSLSAELTGTRRVGWIEWQVVLSGMVPAGSTGLARVAAAGSARVGEELGFFGALGVELADQRGVGEAFEFNGAPVDGGVGTPRLLLGYRAGSWAAFVRWERNHLGASTGFGDSLFTEALALHFSKRW
ncbi:MAG: hypothetical protein AAF654_10360 [Myxococcota bacterium]